MFEENELSLKFCSRFQKNVVTVLKREEGEIFCLSGNSLGCASSGCRNELWKCSFSEENSECENDYKVDGIVI